MSEKDEQERLKNAADQVSRAVRRARQNGGPAAQQQFDRMLNEWPEMAYALARLLQANGTMRPEQWRGLVRPENGWPWAR